MHYNINEAIAEAKKRGVKVQKVDIAKIAWPTCKFPHQTMQYHLKHGVNISPALVSAICHLCGVSREFVLREVE